MSDGRTPEVLEIVCAYLINNGYDGLYRCDGNDTCGCGLEDFAPCSEGPYKDCVAAYRHKDGLYYTERETERGCENCRHKNELVIEGTPCYDCGAGEEFSKWEARE